LDGPSGRIDRIIALESAWRRHLGADAYRRVRAQIDQLRCSDAADTLEAA
jgi:hypothetical protein